jgi:hypothetical protein
MTLALLSRVMWRKSPRRVRREATKLMNQKGEHAFFHACSLASRSQSEGDGRQAQYWQAVCCEISRQIQRATIVNSLLSRGQMLSRERSFSAGR